MALKRVSAVAGPTAADKVIAKQAEIKARKEARAAEAAAKAPVAAPARARIQVVSHSPVVELPCPACKGRTRYLKHATWCPKNTDRQR